MHDVGKVVLNVGTRTRFMRAISLAEEQGMTDEAAERETYGFTHMDVGALLIHRWGLSEGVFHTAHLHHDPEAAEVLCPAHAEICRVVAVADWFADCGPQDGQEEVMSVRLGITPAELERLGHQVRAGYGQDAAMTAA